MRARRSCLSVPARPARKLEKASELVADEVVVDLEDSVPPELKEEAQGGGRRGARERPLGLGDGQRPRQRHLDALVRGRPPGARRRRRAARLGDRAQGRERRRPRSGPRRCSPRPAAARAADRPAGADRVGARAARRERDRRGLAAARGADPRPGRHERLARLPLARGGLALGLRPRRRAGRRPRRRPAGDRRAVPADRRRRRPARVRRRGRGSSASTASGRFTPTRSSRSNELFSPTAEEVDAGAGDPRRARRRASDGRRDARRGDDRRGEPQAGRGAARPGGRRRRRRRAGPAR